MKIASALFAFFVFSGCATQIAPLRSPSAAVDAQVIDQWVEGLLRLASSTELRGDQCQQRIQEELKEFLALDPEVFSLANIEPSQRQAVSSSWLKAMFSSRITLRARAAELGSSGSACVRALRQYLVHVRHAEEYLIEAMVRLKVFPEQDADGKEAAFRGAFPATLVNPKFGNLVFKTGDVLLSRGESALSAQIARAGDVENVFSHAMIVGEDSAGKLYVVETTARDDVAALPLKQYFEENPDARMAVYRHADQALAKRAGRFIYDRITARGKPILYDFHMNENDSSKLFCSEVVQLAYRHASGGRLVLPMFRTDVSRFNRMGKKNWIRMAEIKGDQFFSPSDMDVDPRFEQVAEYRYVDDLRGIRMDDAVMSSMFSWMLGKKYYFAPDPTDHMVAAVGPAVARLFGQGDKIPSGVPRGTIRATLKFDRVFTKIRANLEPLEAAYQKRYGYSMPYAEMLRMNENFRVSDCRKFQVASLVAGESREIDLAPYMHVNFTSKEDCLRGSKR